jgi:uncharacterized membrane protein
MSGLHSLGTMLHDEEIKLLQSLRAARRRAKPEGEAPLTAGQKVADAVAAGMGSWPFIIIQSGMLVLWMAINVIGFVRAWDPYPFILLNLVLSFQAAYAAPFIMMSQNRQAVIDRAEAKGDYDVNRKAALEIELLHQKFDLLREREFAEMIALIGKLEARIETLTSKG